MLFSIFILENEVCAQTIQSHCGTDEAYKQRLLLNPEISDNEKRLKVLIKNITTDSTNLTYKTADLLGVKKIPVVFHLIGDDVFYDTPLSKLINQIDVLNNVYRHKLGTTGYGTGVDVEIEFCLAKKDPEGNVSSGYVVVNGDYPTWPAGSHTMKSLSNWPSDKYLNVWIVNHITAPTFNVIGYSTFPWEFAANPAKDGIVIAKNYVFSLSDPQVQGKNLAHEIGHWLGLKHPFTDDNTCADNDECTDTPDANGIYNTGYLGSCIAMPLSDPLNCPFAPARQIENYMEYTSETCKNKFTDCQKTFMRGYLEAVRSSVIAEDNGAGCDNIDNEGGGGTGNVFCKDCHPRVPYLFINNGLKGSTSGPPRELIASNIKVGGSSYYMAPSATGDIKLIADTRVTGTGLTTDGSITLIDGFYFYSDNYSSIEFFLCDLKADMAHIDIIFLDEKPCSKWTIDPYPDNIDRNKRTIKSDTSIHGVYIKPSLITEENFALKILKITVFPNPSNTGIFTINDDYKSNTKMQYKVYNAIGVIINEGEFINNSNLNLSNKSQGIYHIIVYNEFNQISKTISFN